MAERLDFFQFNAEIDKNGFLSDFPVVGRIGILTYQNADGTIRRELRLPEDVFSLDSLATYEGKPVTLEHPADGKVTPENAKGLVVGAIASKGFRDEDTVRCKVAVWDKTAISNVTGGERTGLSLGYTVDLEETPGEWNGAKYDAIQRNPRINHLSIVKYPRAGRVAHFNSVKTDSFYFLDDKEINNMGKIKLDSGIEYEAAPEVIAEYTKLRKDYDDVKEKCENFRKRADSLAGELEAVKAKEPDMEKIRKDAFEEAKKAVKARLEIEKTADALKIKCDGLTDAEVMKAIIKKKAPSINCDGKSDEYVKAAYDVVTGEQGIANQRATGDCPTQKIDGLPSDQYREKMMKGEQNA